MRVEQLYRIRFSYPDGWKVDLEGGWEQHLYLAEGRCEGEISGRFRGVNFPQRRTAVGPFRPDLRGVVETEDGAVVMIELHGYGRAYPPDDARSLGQLLTSATTTATAVSMTLCASASARSALPTAQRATARTL